MQNKKKLVPMKKESDWWSWILRIKKTKKKTQPKQKSIYVRNMHTLIGIYDEYFCAIEKSCKGKAISLISINHALGFIMHSKLLFIIYSYIIMTASLLSCEESISDNILIWALLPTINGLLWGTICLPQYFLNYLKILIYLLKCMPLFYI